VKFVLGHADACWWAAMQPSTIQQVYLVSNPCRKKGVAGASQYGIEGPSNGAHGKDGIIWDLGCQYHLPISIC